QLLFTTRSVMSLDASPRLAGVACVLFCALAAAPVEAQAPPKAPQWTHGLDLRCRKSTESQFSDKTQTFGVEVFRDDNNGDGLYVLQTGPLAVARGFGNLKAPLPDSKAPEWLHGLDLKCRKGGEIDFAKARVFGIEVFRDDNTGNWIYITEVGTAAVAPGAKAGKGPTIAP